MSADAAECSPFTDAGLTRSERSLPPSIAAIPDDRLLTVADVCALLQIRKSVVYAACDHGDLAYVKFEGAVQIRRSVVYGACDHGDLEHVKFEGAVRIEGRDLKHWIVSVPSKPLGPA